MNHLRNYMNPLHITGFLILAMTAFTAGTSHHAEHQVIQL